jgi:hypothetical protein
MQISANNLLLASQQARAPQPAKPQAAGDAFEPLPFKQTASSKPASTPAPPEASPQRPGSLLDIRI